MKISEILQSSERGYSIEFFPPKTDQGVSNLSARLDRFLNREGGEKGVSWAPLFVDLTWGAGGSTSERSLEVAKMLSSQGAVVNLHLTCTNMDPELIDQALEFSDKAGISNIVALRGDPPQDLDGGVDGGVDDGLSSFHCARDLVRYIREKWDDRFGIAVSGYPEGHPNAITEISESEVSGLSATEKGRLIRLDGRFYVCKDADFTREISYLKTKVDAGADFVITQMFFDVPVYLAFVRACRWAGIDCPILPGVMLIQNLAGFQKMTRFCKTRIPEWVDSLVQGLIDGSNGDLDSVDKSSIHDVGVEVAVRMGRELLENGVKFVHWYVLNQEEVMMRVLRELYD